VWATTMGRGVLDASLITLDASLVTLDASLVTLSASPASTTSNEPGSTTTDQTTGQATDKATAKARATDAVTESAVRVYAHCTASAAGGGKGEVTVLVINLSTEGHTTVSMDGALGGLTDPAVGAVQGQCRDSVVGIVFLWIVF
jgi:hypothetical protein